MRNQDWVDLAAAQHGMVAQRQLTARGVSRAFVRHQLNSGRWRQATKTVVSTTTGPLSWHQRLWCAVLHAGPKAVIGGLTALAVHGLRGWDRENITVLVSNELSFDPIGGVRFFRTRRSIADLRSGTALPLCAVAPAALLFAAHERNGRTAHGCLAATVQQRLTTVTELAEWLERLRPLRRAREFRGLLADLGHGAQSLAEVDLRRACRRFGLAAPISQRERRDRSGRRRFSDAEWTLPNGRTLVLEVDGGFHDNVVQATADRARNRGLTTADRTVITCSAYELRHEPETVVRDLIALGVPRVEC